MISKVTDQRKMNMDRGSEAEADYKYFFIFLEGPSSTSDGHQIRKKSPVIAGVSQNRVVRSVVVFVITIIEEKGFLEMQMGGMIQCH